jgi:hypothetical protein
VRALILTESSLCEHASLLGESTTLEFVAVTLLEQQSFGGWARANGALMNASRLRSVRIEPVEKVYRDYVDAPPNRAETTSAAAVLQAAWEARPAGVNERRAAAAAANGANRQLAIKVYCCDQLCVFLRACLDPAHAPLYFLFSVCIAPCAARSLLCSCCSRIVCFRFPVVPFVFARANGSCRLGCAQ